MTMLQIFTTTTQQVKIITMLFAGLAASSLHPAFASGTEEDRVAATKDAVAYHAAVEDLKSEYADKQAYDKALDELAIDLAGQEDLFNIPAKAKVYNTDFELVGEYAAEEEVLGNDEGKLMVYNNTTYYIQ